MKAIIGLGEIKELLRSEKFIRVILIAGAALILLTALGGLFGKSSGKDEANGFSAEGLTEYEHGLEKRLTEILSDIEGVGKASVMITLDTSERTEYGKSSDMLISVTAPKVRGVIVVCEGGGGWSMRFLGYSV